MGGASRDPPSNFSDISGEPTMHRPRSYAAGRVPAATRRWHLLPPRTKREVRSARACRTRPGNNVPVAREVRSAHAGVCPKRNVLPTWESVPPAPSSCTARRLRSLRCPANSGGNVAVAQRRFGSQGDGRRARGNESVASGPEPLCSRPRRPREGTGR
jgi:hypothetical protein